jgi:glycosyltransferase involved in cell wall biosynthesis
MIRRFLILPDDQIGWLPSAYVAAVNIIKAQNIKAIYSTSPPNSSHLIAYLVKRKTGVPWIADFRDEWFDLPSLVFPTAMHRNIHYHLERSVVRNADRLIAASPVFGEMLEKHGSLNAKISTITNGFDAEDFQNQSQSGNNGGSKSKFVVSFIGLFHGATNPNSFLKSLQQLIAEGKIDPEKVSVRFVGANTINDIDFHDTHGICDFTGFVSHKEAIRYLCKTDALLLILSEARGTGIIPGKTFEYLAGRKPILALVPPNGETAKIIRTTDSGVIVDPENIEEIKKSYLDLYRRWEKNQMALEFSWNGVSNFERKTLTGRLSQILDSMVLSDGSCKAL